MHIDARAHASAGAPLPDLERAKPGGFLQPQWEGNRLTGPLVYRRMLNAFYRGIKAIDRRNVIVTGGTSRYGDPPGGSRLDALAHHPINTSGGMFRGALHRDDASSADM
jgi:hypothetical protein